MLCEQECCCEQGEAGAAHTVSPQPAGQPLCSLLESTRGGSHLVDRALCPSVSEFLSERLPYFFSSPAESRLMSRMPGADQQVSLLSLPSDGDRAGQEGPELEQGTITSLPLSVAYRSSSRPVGFM